MITLEDIRYVRLGARDLDESCRFARDFLGLVPVGREGKIAYFKSDSRDHTLAYIDGGPLAGAVGFELKDHLSLEDAAAQLEQAGYPVRLGTREEAEIMRVRDFLETRDP